MDGVMVQAVVGGVLGLLLSTIAYFLKLLIQDIREMGKDLGRLKEVVVRVQSEQTLIKSLLRQGNSTSRSRKNWPIA
jgi:hypothetical protein